MLQPNPNSYNTSFLSARELETRLSTKVDPLSLTRILDAYEMARSVHEFQVRNDGSPYFHHSTRVCKILLDELEIYDADVLIGSLLHDVLEDSDTVTRSVLEYNFGSYVAYLIETLTKDLSKARSNPDHVDIEHAERLRTASEDCLVIKLAARLDNMRCLWFNLKRNPLTYVRNTFERYLPMADASSNVRLKRLAEEIRKEANKFLG